MSRLFQDILDAVHAMKGGTASLWRQRTVAVDDQACMRARVERCWPVWPMGQKKRGTSGLRIVPGASVSAWAMAHGSSDVAVTLGSNAATTTPFTALALLVAPLPTQELVDDRRRDWPRIRAGLAVLHGILGGAPERLDELGAVLFDPEVLRLSGVRLNPVARRPMENQVLRRLDPTPVHLQFRDFAEAQFDSAEPLVVPEQLGLWETFALTLSFGRGYTSFGYPVGGTVSAMTSETAWRLLHQAPQFDTGHVPHEVGHLSIDGGITSADAYAAAMVAVTKAPQERLVAWTNSPLVQCVLLRAGKDHSGPWHLGYMEAAAGYDGLEQPEVAWNMLCAGAFWVNRRGGPWRPFFDAALALSQRRGWTDCAAALENMAKRAGL